MVAEPVIDFPAAAPLSVHDECVEYTGLNGTITVDGDLLNHHPLWPERQG